MVTDINFGSISNIGGRTVTSGSASGLDTEGLINSLVEARRLPAVSLEDDIISNNSQITALNEFSGIVENLQSSLNALRNPTGIGSAGANAFDSRTAFLSTSDGSTASNFVGVVVNDGASVGNFTVEVNQLAQGAIFQSASFTSRDEDIVGSGEAGLLNAGSFELNGSTITVNENDTLNSLATRINNVSSNTDVEASVLQISDTDFRLILTSTDTGLTDGGITIGGDSSNNSGVFADNNFSQIQDPQNSEFNYLVGATSTTISRQTNTINDFVDNVSITLFQETPADTEVTIEVGTDVQAVSEAIVDFVNAYNDLRVFNAEQNQVDDNGDLLETAALSNSLLLDNTISSLASQLASSVNVPTTQAIGASQSTERLGDLGITFVDFVGSEEDDIPATANILEVDPAILTSRIQSNFDDVRGIFELSFVSDNDGLAVFDSGETIRSETLAISVSGGNSAVLTSIDGNSLASDFALDFNTTDERVTGTFNDDTGEFEGAVAGLVAVIQGPAGSAFEGFEILYFGDGDSEESAVVELNGGQKNYTIDVNDDDATAQLTSIRGLELADPIELTYSQAGSSATISGAEGGPLGGLELLYVGGSTETINFNFRQGIADTLFNSLEETFTGDSTGLIAQEISGITTSSNRFQDSIDRIDAQIVTFRDRLLIQFAALEAAIASSESILQLLSAQSDARNNT